MPGLYVLLLGLLLIVVVLVDLDGEVLFGKRRATRRLVVLALFKLFKSHEGTLVPTARCRGGDGAGVEFEEVRADRVGGTIEF
jgi:hypothetical protein